MKTRRSHPSSSATPRQPATGNVHSPQVSPHCTPEARQWKAQGCCRRPGVANHKCSAPRTGRRIHANADESSDPTRVKKEPRWSEKLQVATLLKQRPDVTR